MIDKYLAWINVQIVMIDEEMAKLDDGRKKHELHVRLRAMKDAKNSYCRLKGV